MRPQASKITTEGLARYNGDERAYEYYLQRVEQAVNNLAHSSSIDLEVLFYAILCDSGVFAETLYTGNADTNYFLGARDLGHFLLQRLVAKNPDMLYCLNGKEAVRLFIENKLKGKGE